MKKFLLFLALLFSINYANSQWQQLSLVVNNVACIATKGDTIIAGTDGDGVYISKNNGSSWAKMDSGLTNLHVWSLVLKEDSLLFAGTKNGVFLFNKNSSTWVAVDSGIPVNTHVGSLISSGSNIFAGVDDGTGYGVNGSGVFLSSNNGSSWNATSIIYGVNTLAISGSNIIALTDFAGVFLSSDNGNSWTGVNKGFADSSDVISLAASGTDIFAGTDNGVYLSSNNGGLWTAVNNGLTEAATDSIALSLAVSGSNIFAGMWHGVFLSNDNGNSWTSLGLSSYATSVLAVNDNYVFASISCCGIWRLPLSELGIEEINNSEINIAVYPNPATDYLTIKSQKPARIEIRDIQGQLIKTLIASNNKTNLDVSTFASGVYVVEVKTENGIAVKKFLKE